jgi:dTDP-4-dehydrorhamnose 3,5-epimerase
MALNFKHLEVPDLILISGQLHKDQRGYFTEIYKESEYKKNGILESFVQDNFSYSKKNVLRGLHFQFFPKAQGKLVRVLEGTIWDVAIDVRKNSSNFKKWVAVELSEENGKALYIPAGFAHGFLTLSETAKVLYKTTAEYDSELEEGILWNDIDINITWPISNPILSKKDSLLPNLMKAHFFEK